MVTGKNMIDIVFTGDPLQLSKLTGEAGRTIENYSFVSNMESGIFPQEK